MPKCQYFKTSLLFLIFHITKKDIGHQNQYLCPYIVIDKTLNFIIPFGALASTVCPFLAPKSACPIGDSLEILLFNKSTSVDPTIVYVTSSSNSTS